MKNESCSSQASPGSIRSWFGFGRTQGANANSHVIAQADLTRLRRGELLNAVSSFILENDLEVSAENLLAAYSIFAGSNVRLARVVKQRSSEGAKISQQWLDDALEEEAERPCQHEVDRLMTKAEYSINSFTATAKAAHSASSQYGAELERHSDKLSRAKEAGVIVANLAELAQVMLDQTRKVEAEMRQSEEEAHVLRRNLERAKRDAAVDHLTGLPNRRAFEVLLEHHYKMAQSAIEPLCVAFCDIDHFKKINDTHGHDTGDRVIQAIAETLGKITDENCHVARHGGEEFVMLFNGQNASQAYARLDQVRANMACRKFVNRKTDQPIGQVTFSGGIADVFSYTNPREALAAADDALYRAKEGGRNQIVLARTSER